MSVVVGVDGCKAGWFHFSSEGGAITHGISASFDALVQSLPDHSRVFVDIPIGLVDDAAEGRRCDREARRLLGRGRSSSVFSAPCRSVLAASDYDQARQVSRRAIGKMLSKQAFLITPRIREVDRFLRRRERDLVVREAHPEVCFWALNQRQPMAFRKKDQAGFDQRLALLRRYIAHADRLVGSALGSYLRKQVAADDVLDALVLLLVAGTSDGALQTAPAIPETDAHGLAMEIVYTERPDWRLCGHAPRATHAGDNLA
jgi:predicted RNase H-like nuclease